MEEEKIIKIILILVFVLFVLPALLYAVVATFLATRFRLISPIDAWIISLVGILCLASIWFFSRRLIGKKEEEKTSPLD